jgi:hypothetical protein
VVLPNHTIWNEQSWHRAIFVLSASDDQGDSGVDFIFPAREVFYIWVITPVMKLVHIALKDDE